MALPVERDAPRDGAGRGPRVAVQRGVEGTPWQEGYQVGEAWAGLIGARTYAPACLEVIADHYALLQSRLGGGATYPAYWWRNGFMAGWRQAVDDRRWQPGPSARPLPEGGR